MSMITELVKRLRESADNTELDMECSLACDGECNKLLREAAYVIEELSAKLQEPVLDKIRAEIMSKDGLEEALEIINKYKAESEG